MTTKIGKYCTVAADVKFGKGVIVHGFANLYGCYIDDDSRIGTFVEIQKGAQIGKRVRIQSHSFICSGIVIEDDVFIGHNVSFINDRHPTVQTAAEGTWTLEGSHVCAGASIGTGAVIMCGVKIGERAVVGAGSVVTRDVPPFTVVAGVPASMIKTVSPGKTGLRGGVWGGGSLK